MENIFAQQTPAIPIEPPRSLTNLLIKVLLTCGTILCLVLYMIYQSGRSLTQRFFLLPPTDFRQTFKEAFEKPNGLLPSSKIGIKKASYRRRLIMAGSKPQSYSTLPLNSVTGEDNIPVDNVDNKYYRLRIANNDRLPENKEHFLMNIKPIGPRDFNRKTLYGFFHPFSYALGGGEKVLWEAVISTLENDNNNIAIIYTFTPSSDSSAFSILDGVKKTFGIDFFRQDRQDVRDRIVFIHLPDKYQWLINGNSYKFLSMIGQAIGSILLVFFGFYQVTPDIFIDTIGVPFTYVFVYGLLDIPIISYIHYPSVSKDMLKAAKNIGGLYGILKYSYWWILLKLYAFNIMWVDISLYNSSWTADNVINAISWIGDQTVDDEDILYPPCVSYDDIQFDKDSVQSLTNMERERCIVYLAQFRPEKRHSLLIKHYKDYLNEYENRGIKDPHKLVFIGSTRSIKDEEYIYKLQELIKEFEIPSELIVFELNASSQIVDKWLKISDFGINCMWKEHFGIAVVEYMLNGCIPLAHASAGPLEDIIIPRVDGHVLTKKEYKEHFRVLDNEKSGLFFKDETDPDFQHAKVEDYPSLTEMLLTASAMSYSLKTTMRENAIYVAREKFGRGVFSKRWNRCVFDITEIEKERRELRGSVEQVY